MCSVYIYCLSMLLRRTYFCPVVVNPDFVQNHMVLSLTVLIIHIFATITVDDQYESLAANFLHTGRGRPPSQPKEIQYDSRLLVQLKTLRSEGQKTLDDVQVFFQKCFPDIDRTASSISGPFSSTTGTPTCPKPACSSR